MLTDIANEPDDRMSLVRLLVYSNQFDLEGLVATTSRHLRKGPRPDVIRTVLDAYAKVQPNLLKHEPGYPEAAALSALVVSGQDAYRMEAVGPGKTTEGAELIVEGGGIERPAAGLGDGVGRREHARAGAVVARSTRSAADVERIVSKLRVYTISDQDDAGPWLRREFPMLHYIATPGDHVDYHDATWTGLAGDEFYKNAPGADWTTVSEAWLNEHVRNKGPLGAYYPLPCCMIEGDTPSFLSLIDNGLAAYMNPSFGGWGGRYVASAVAGDAAVLDEQPRVTRYGDGCRRQVATSDQATIWRWRTAYMHDFAARMAWTVSGVADANHNPDVVVNGVKGRRRSRSRRRWARRSRWMRRAAAIAIVMRCAISGSSIPKPAPAFPAQRVAAPPAAPPPPATHPAPAPLATAAPGAHRRRQPRRASRALPRW